MMPESNLTAKQILYISTYANIDVMNMDRKQTKDSNFTTRHALES